ncbi:MAG TPA: ABC transporter permease [Methanobacterium sp.]|nr:ABC transporter permease [Methanobacterium sp.]
MSNWLMSFRNLKRRRLRTVFTISGILVGIALMVVLLAMLNGMDTRLNEQVRGLTGADLTVYNSTTQSGGGQGSQSFIIQPYDNIDEVNAEIVKNISSVDAVSSTLTFNGFAKSLNNDTQLRINGIEPDSYNYVAGGINVVNGSSLKQGDDNSVVIGKSVSTALGIGVGDKISIGRNEKDTREFTVVGIYETGMGIMDAAGYISLDAAQNLTDKEGQISNIQVKTKDPNEVDEITNVIPQKVHGVKVITQKSIIQKMTDMLNTIQIFVSSLGLIALLAGSFGVINTMLMSVYERTREIGILKAIGSRNIVIMKMFLIEAVLIGVISSTLGCVLGTIIIYTLPLTNDIMAPIISPSIISIAIVLGIAVSTIAGIYPAWRASKMNIVEAIKNV